MFQTNLVEKIEAHFYVQLLFLGNRAFYEIVGKEYVTARLATDSITWCTRSACWITKAADTHSEYVIVDIVGTVYHLVIHMQSNKIHKVLQ